jgi:hypothetical protein
MPKLMDSLKSLPLTIILTVLIWMYAEAQFTATEDNVPITLHVAPMSSDQSIRMLEPADGLLHIRVEGPQAQVERFRQTVLHITDSPVDELGAMVFTPQQKLNIGSNNWVDSAQAVNSIAYFQKHGITVTSASPGRIRLETDRVVQLRKPILFHGNIVAKIEPSQADVLLPQTLRDTVGEKNINVYARPLRDLDSLPRDVDQTIPAQLMVEYPGPSDERVVVNPQQATLTLRLPRQREQSLVIPSVPVFVSGPPDLLAKNDVEIRPRFVQILVSGPETVLGPIRAAMAHGAIMTPDPRIRAYLDLDVGDKPADVFSRRALRYVYPAGMELRQTPDQVEFRLVAPATPATDPK